MDYTNEFERIREKASYVQVEDNISALARSIDHDPKDLGYGIARNILAYGDFDEIRRFETQVKDVENKLQDIEDGIADFDTRARAAEINRKKASLAGLIDQKARTINWRGTTTKQVGYMGTYGR